MYTIADLANIGIDIVGTIGVWVLHNIEGIVFIALIWLAFYTGVWVTKRQIQMKGDSNGKSKTK